MSKNGYEKLIKKYEDYRRNLSDVLETRILEETAVELQSKVKKRIFEDGLDANGNLISQSYSTKPMNVRKEVFIKPSAFSGKKTMKLNYGYKELRDIQGLPTSKVNLDYSGKLKRNIHIARIQKSVVLGVNTTEDAEKVKHLEQKYNTKIFGFTQNEIKEHMDNVFNKIKENQRTYFHGN
ncbi:hypothetical protein EGI16_03415 [Chryseobacterium sp. G0240]|uniref:hypothetical protein n=1 Tax=Chryseobacterium sp. G0240 TaxID=2487066 RepID=UPI000F45521F|nr:hypothetical protein [Chryseobacterium sp. G0240]ROI05448.1 hypothetical protein EGI16_03415 [Chryseobacterium sp. G0240]